MKITIKTITKSTFIVDTPDGATVADLKEQIAQEHGHAVPTQTLVFSGKVLKDGDTLEQSGIKEGATLIFFVKQQKNQPAAKAPSNPPQPPQTAQTTAPAPVTPPAQPSQTEPTSIVEPPKQEPVSTTPTTGSTPSQTTPPAAPQQASTTATQASPALPNSQVERLVNMGFAKTEVEAALRASFGDPNRAIDLLTSGMPIPDVPDSFSGSPDDGVAGLLPDLPVETGPTPLLDELPSHPQFPAIRRIVATGPQGLQLLMQTFTETAPALAQEIASHPMKFTQILMGGSLPTGGADESEDESSNTEHSSPSSGSGSGSSTSSGSAPMPTHTATQPSPSVPQISAADETNIQQIISITGASRPAALQAYLVCDKNVESAINLLFDS